MKTKLEWFSVEEILTWDTCDFCARYNSLSKIVEKCRKDEQYEVVKASIRKWGFRRALSYTIKHDGKVHGDGHHRLTAAIDLGYKYVPYVKRFDIAEDSWNFDEDDLARIGSRNKQYLHPYNPIPEKLNRHGENQIREFILA